MINARVLAPVLAGLVTTALAGATALLGVTAHVQIQAVRDNGALADPASVLIALAAAAATLVAARLVVCAAATGVALVASSADSSRAGSPGAVAARIAMVTSPRSIRPAMAVLLAGGLALAVAAPAIATPVGVAPVAVAVCANATPGGRVADPAPHLPAPGWQSLPQPGWLPSRPPRPPASAEQAPGALVELVSSGATPDGTADHELVVRRGDTLWALASRALGSGASAAEIAAEWPRWWQTNRRVIGADPDLLVPGTRLTAPAPLANTLLAHTTTTEGS